MIVRMPIVMATSHSTQLHSSDAIDLILNLLNVSKNIRNADPAPLSLPGASGGDASQD